MKSWKLQIVERLNADAMESREIEFDAVAMKCGVKRMKYQEIMEVCRMFMKENPTYKMYQFLSDPKKPYNIFHTLVLSELEYEID